MNENCNRFESFETPYQLWRDLNGTFDVKTRTPSIQGLLDKEFQNQPLTGRRIFYHHDEPYLRVERGLSGAERNAVHQNIFTIIQDLRLCIYRWLKGKGADVITPHPRIDFCFARPRAGRYEWTTVVDHPGQLLKVKSISDAFSYPDISVPFESPYIVPERVFSAGEFDRFTLAPDLSDLLTLNDFIQGNVINRAERVRIIGQGIAGNMVMHALGMAHCDIKPGNIFYDYREPKHPIGKLFDLEFAQSFGSGKFYLFTPTFDENSYFAARELSEDEQSFTLLETAAIDDHRDKFSWVITLLLALSSDYQALYDDLRQIQQNVVWTGFDKVMQEQTLFNSIHLHLPPFGELREMAMKLAQLDRTKRPPLARCLETLAAVEKRLMPIFSIGSSPSE